MSDAAVTTDIRRIGVVGCGLMGSGIAEVSARAGLDVLVREFDAAAAERARDRVVGSLERGVRSKKLTEEQRDAAIARLTFTTDMDEMADRQLVVEAVLEDEAAKTEVFSLLDKIVTDENAILASNTSSIPVMKLGIATKRPEQVIGIHFFNPVPVLRLVELVPSLLTSPETLERAKAFAVGALNKKVVHCQDRAGFVVNALLFPYLNNAVRMLENGTAELQDIDTAMKGGCNFPMGPFALLDLVGLDTSLSILDALYDEFRDPNYAAVPLLRRMVAAGQLGRKTKRGFFHY